MREFDELLEIIRKLRDPVRGCPWDIQQTHRSLIPNFIEELYETVEAIERNDVEHLSEELGDLLLHILMQTQIACEHDEFTMEEVLQRISRKLLHRHPHVFGNYSTPDAQGVKMNWERIKKREKSRDSILDGIPTTMPALITAQRIQEKAAAVGFDWHDSEPVLEKMDEEIDELKKALVSGSDDEIQKELGDILFTVVNLSRKLGYDAETCLRGSIRKFDKRFRAIENHFRKNKLDINESTLEQLDEIWNKIKKNNI
ncbi:MAG: nucleoside triphosphate pyrophosphohydrolase [Candidatus Cloacimonetes bacterium]|nr:nucleoside triphosphate pyrophosphohydrolase [Candidatus Cloacimonadota bacterium]